MSDKFNDWESDEKVAKINGLPVKKPKRNTHVFGSIILILVLVIVILCLYVFGIKRFSNDNTVSDLVDNVEDALTDEEGSLETITESSLEKVFEISELQTAEYIYNAVTQVDGEKGVKYYVAYQGTVTAGVNFDEIDISVDEEQKKIYITIPDVSIQDTIVDAESLEYIFTKDKYDDENVFVKAYAKAQDDLDERAKSDKELLKLAEDNVRQVVTGMVTPWVDQIDSEYEIIVQ